MDAGDEQAARDLKPAVEQAYAAREQAELLLTEADEIRKPLAYAATARANQGRVSDTLAAIRGNTSMPETEREIIASAITSIGNTSSRQAAQGIATDALDRLAADRREYVRSLLSPLVQQIKR